MAKKSASAAPTISIGISEKDRAAIAAGLSKLLADTYTLYLTTHNFHWNVTGPQFNSLHAMFMTQYTEQWTALDEIADRLATILREHGTEALANYTGNPSAFSVTVDFATKDGTAVAPSDYTAVSGTMTWTPGSTQRTLNVYVIKDLTLEANETFTVVLSGPTGATLADTSALGTIKNDD